MIEFSKQISEKWNIPAEAAEAVCNAYEKGDSPYYLAEYNSEFSMDMSISMLWEIFDFLQEMDELGSKKKRAINAYMKADLISPELERRINFTTNPFELDDLLIPMRPNPRSRGQIAVNKGLKPLAERLMAQEDESVVLEELAEPYVGKDPSLKSVDDVIQGVKDVLAEMVAYDETVRAMAREFASEDGFFEVTPKNKKDAAFASYVGRSVSINELSMEELLRLFMAEDRKLARVKLGVQLFRIGELLRHHFITNPDAAGFDLICATIDESWLRLLQPIVERDVKIKLREQAEQWASKRLMSDLEKLCIDEASAGTLLIVDAGLPKQINFITVSSTGELLGTTTERKVTPDATIVPGERLKQFFGRYRPERIAIVDNDGASVAEELIKRIFADVEDVPGIFRSKPATAANASCDWIGRELGTLLDDVMKRLYADALLILKPVSLLPKVGLDFYSVHPFQQLVTQERFQRILGRIRTAASLRSGIPVKDILDSAIREIPSVSAKQLQAIVAADKEGQLTTKNDMLKVAGMTEVVFRNIAGFIVISGADSPLDRTVIHPDFYDWFFEIAEQLNVSIETLVTEPEYLRSFQSDDFHKKVIIEKKIIPQLNASRRHLMQPAGKVRRKLKLNEVEEGTIISGRVTNITPFGVFVNIHAVCDGLIHISQLADEYVESPDQVVSVNDRVDVRVLKVDIKKRRISLSMRNLGTMAPKVRPSRGQLDNLAEHFKNR